MTLEQIENLANHLIGRHVPGWKFGWNRRKTANGVCKYATNTIELSAITNVLRDENSIRETIMHEIAHALTPGAKHGPEWQAQMRKFGYEPSRCAKDDSKVPYTWVMKFNNEVVRGWYRKPNQSTFNKLPHTFLKGRKEETIGRLVIERV